MKTIAIINQKGGVAKSTTALALGAGFLSKGERVLFVDLDAQGNLSYTLSAAAQPSVYEALVKSKGALECVQALSEKSGILASSPALATADIALTATGKEYRLREALEALGSAYDLCIIDTPPSLGILTINALTAAGGVIIPAQADIFSLQGIQQLHDTLEVTRRYCNSELKVLGIVLTRFQKRAIISREVADMLSETASALGTKLFSTRIRECTALKEAQARRESIFTYAPSSNAALDYKELFKEVQESM